MRISSNPLPIAGNFPAGGQIAHKSFNMTTNLNTSKQEYFAKVDKLAVDYIMKLSTVTTDSDIAKNVTVFANQALDNIERCTSVEGMENVIHDFENSLKRLYTGNTDESATDDALDHGLKQQNIVTAIAKSYAKSLTNEQVLSIYDIIEPMFTSLTCSEHMAKRLLYVLGYDSVSDMETQIMQQTAENAFNNRLMDPSVQGQPIMTAADESAALRHVLDYGEMLVNNASYRIPAIEKTLDDIERYLEPIKESDIKLTVQTCFDDVKTLAKQQRSSSALIASQYVQELKNKFNDWKLATQYGAKYGTYPAKAAYQKRAEELVAAKTQIIESLCHLLDDIAKQFHCAASYIAKKSATGLDVLQVKFISNFMQADETVYIAIQNVLQSLNFSVRIIKPDNFTCIMYVGIDNRDFQVQTPILSKDQAECVCRQLIQEKLAGIEFDGLYDISNVLANFVNAKSMQWWQMILSLQKVLTEPAATMQLAWPAIYPETRIRLLQYVNASELLANTAAQLQNISWNELYDMTKEEILKKLFA